MSIVLRFYTAITLALILGISTDAFAIANAVNVAQDGSSIDKLSRSVVAIHVKIEGRDRPGVCSGVLITSQIVLTAGHCLLPAKSNDDLAVATDQIDVNRPDSSFLQIKSYQIFPGYQLGQEGALIDIGIIVLAKPIMARAHPKIASSEFRPREHSSVLAMGFGQGFPDDPIDKKSGILRYLIFSRGQYFLTDEPRGLIQVRNGMPSIQHGDSGSPLFAFENGSITVVGILTLGSEIDGSYIDIGSPNLSAWISGASKK